MNTKEQVEYTALLNMMITIGALTEEDVSRILGALPELSPYHAKEVLTKTEELLARANYQKPTILQRIGLKKS